MRQFAPSQNHNSMGRRTLFLINRNARCGQEDFTELRERLTAGGLDLIEPKTEISDTSGVIRKFGRDVELIVLGGGDGTINRALNGLMEVQIPFGILPLGTANDLARTLELPTDLIAACDVILCGRTRRIDVGQVNGRLFLNVASIGLAAEVTRRLNRGAKSRWGVLAYLWAAIGAMVKGRSFSVEIRSGGEILRTRTWQISIGNGRSYGGGLTIHDKASIDDGLLDLYSLEVEHSWHLLPLIPALWRGELDPVLAVRTMHGTTFQIRPLSRPRSIIADGELIGKTPADFHLLPQALSVCVPANSLEHASVVGDRPSGSN